MFGFSEVQELSLTYNRIILINSSQVKNILSNKLIYLDESLESLTISPWKIQILFNVQLVYVSRNLLEMKANPKQHKGNHCTYRIKEPHGEEKGREAAPSICMMSRGAAESLAKYYTHVYNTEYHLCLT